MTNQGKCPKCEKTLLHVRVESIIGIIDDKNRLRCLSFSCIHCNTVLNVQMDARTTRRPRTPAE